MKSKLMMGAISLLLFAACKKESNVNTTTTTPAVEANWSSSAAFGGWSNNGYDFLNDVWGTGTPKPGPQSIWANSYTDWGVWANHYGGGIKSYPHVRKNINKNINSLSYCTSNFTVSNPGGGSYSTDYDIWLNGTAYEIMLWTNKQGAVGPIATNYNSNGGIPEFTNQWVGGHTWNVYKGRGGSGGTCISFVRTSNTNSGTIDLKAIMLWIQSKGWYNNPYLNGVEFGWEITNTDGVGKNFGCSRYSVSAQ